MLLDLTVYWRPRSNLNARIPRTLLCYFVREIRPVWYDRALSKVLAIATKEDLMAALTKMLLCCAILFLHEYMDRRFDVILATSALQNLWVRRVIAFIVDSLILLLVFALVYAILAIVLLVPSLVFNFNLFGGLFSGFSVVFGLLIVWGYYTGFEGSIGGTIGKRFMDLRVRPLHGKMSYTKAFVRNFTKAWIPLFAFLFLLDLVIGLATKGDPRQRFSDVAAETIVTAR